MESFAKVVSPGLARGVVVRTDGLEVFETEGPLSGPWALGSAMADSLMVGVGISPSLLAVPEVGQYFSKGHS